MAAAVDAWPDFLDASPDGDRRQNLHRPVSADHRVAQRERGPIGHVACRSGAEEVKPAHVADASVSSPLDAIPVVLAVEFQEPVTVDGRDRFRAGFPPTDDWEVEFHPRAKASTGSHSLYHRVERPGKSLSDSGADPTEGSRRI